MTHHSHDREGGLPGDRDHDGKPNALGRNDHDGPTTGHDSGHDSRDAIRKLTSSTVYDRDGDKVGSVGQLFLDARPASPAGSRSTPAPSAARRRSSP
ncbi:hypothetical protein [Mariniluteicoccus flavus]